ncbi:hypothetical protein SKAU_G00055010 [Synaphobranchus kaupii]|uniref:Uncharacterized protein n=1 Tax=Synaphobranchus kaupii TaxID=118154 RepID=A0A9Q1G484_SYNKA|nr:hypothetical protein SKAU_G00055010 [Synaphobranchus kaupii]
MKQSLVLPAPSDVVPSMVLQFRLLSFPGRRGHIGSVAAWGAFPVCDCSFDIVQGKFRTPLLRGERDPALDQFRKVEELVSSDLDNWLCNLYFQVKKLPRGALQRGGAQRGPGGPLPNPAAPGRRRWAGPRDRRAAAPGVPAQPLRALQVLLCVTARYGAATAAGDKCR